MRNRGRNGRKLGNRPVKQVVRLVTEDTGGVKSYLSQICRELTRNNNRVNIGVVPGLDSAPKRVIDRAEILTGTLSGGKPRGNQEWGEADFAIAVLDDDEDPATTRELERVDGNDKVELSVSRPCFEIWYILHFSDCTKVLPRDTDAQRELNKTGFPSGENYDKTKTDMYEYCKEKGDSKTASVRAKRLRAELLKTNSTNPFTYADILIENIEECANSENPIKFLKENCNWTTGR